MKIMTLRLLGLGVLALSLLGACAKNDREPDTNSANRAGASISLEIELGGDERLYDEETGEFRAMDFVAEANKQGRPHPSLSLALREGQQIPMALVFKNSRTGKSFIQKDVAFTYKGNKLEVEGLQLSEANDNELNNQDWHMLVVLGGTWQGKTLRFNATQNVPLMSRGSIALEAVYMSKAWVGLDVKSQTVQGQRKITLSVKKDARGNSLPVQLKNQCMTLMFRMQRNDTPDAVDFYGLGLNTSDLSFSGTYDFAQGALDVTSIPIYTPSVRGYAATFRATQPQRLPANSDRSSDYIYCVGVPKPGSNTSNMRLFPYVSARLEFSRYADKTNVPIQAGAYIGVNDVYIRRPDLDHPIEAVLTSDGERVYHNDNVTLNQALNTGGTYSEDGIFRRYSLPNIYQMAVLVPTMRDSKKLLPQNIHAIMDFQRKESWDGTERIATWGTEPHDYTASFRPGADNIFYATRLHDGSATGGNYYSAYRYERKGDILEIQVRELKGQTVTDPPKRMRLGKKWVTLPSKPRSIAITDIANENFWNTPPKWNQREYKRVIEAGVYWSTTQTKRAKLATINHGMKIFTTWGDDQNASKPNAAYVGREDYGSFADNPNKAKNKTGKRSILMTTDRVSSDRASRHR